MRKAQFTIRVHLNDAQATSYAKLHEKLAKKGYTKSIVGRSGKTYLLPDADYILESILDERGVANEVVAIANSISPSSSVLVTKSAGMAVRGLKPA